MSSPSSDPIQVIPYDPQWPQMFEKEARLIHEILGENCIEVHHVGSTAVLDLAAKPKIDIIGVVEDLTNARKALADSGYTDKGEWNIPFQGGLTKRGETNINLHLFEPDHPEVELNLTFRDILRHNVKLRDEYAALKSSLLQDPSSFEKEGRMFSGYNLGKDAFIRSVLRNSGFNRLRFLRCVHRAEWDFAKRIRQQEFFGKAGIEDPYTWTFDHPDHVHLILIQGVDPVGYAHIQLWPEKRAALRIIVIDESRRSQGLGGYFLGQIERWLPTQGIKTLHTESSPAALGFYVRHAYGPMPFNDPEAYEGDPQDTPLGKVFS